MTVRKLLRNKGNFVPFIRSDSTIADVLEILEADDAGALVVTDDQRTILGIISERDIVRALRTEGPAIMNRPVEAFMTREVIACDHREPITSVLQLMDRHQVRHIPITENGQLCGIITMLDLVRYRLSQLEMEAGALKDYVAGRA